ncbi:MAG: hypothetical protein ACM3ML_32120 [Micromonosporaceae bacterium]
MKLNRKRVVTGIAATGIAAGVLAGGGAAFAATSATPAPAASTSASPPCGMRADYGYGQFGGMHVQAGQQTVLAAAARYLGLTQTELRTQLQAGKSFADVAKAQGKSVSGLKDAILAAVTSRVNANTRLTAEQKETILAQVKSNLDTIVNATHPAGAGLGPIWARR